MRKIGSLCIVAALLAACSPDKPRDLENEPPLNCSVGITKDYGAVNDITVTPAKWGFAVAVNGSCGNCRGRVETLTSDGYSHTLPADLDFPGGDIATLADKRLMVVGYMGTETALLSEEGQLLSQARDLPARNAVTPVSSSGSDWMLWNESYWNGSGYDISSWLGRIVEGSVETIASLPFTDHFQSAAALSIDGSELILAATDPVKCGSERDTRLGLKLLAVAGSRVSTADIVVDGATGNSDKYLGESKVMTVNGGFAVLWSRRGYDQGVEQHLTYVGADGSVGRTLSLPAVSYIVWNGTGFTAVSVPVEDDHSAKSIVMRQFDADGKVLGAGVIADASETEQVYNATGLHVVGGTRFAVDWILWDKKGREPDSRWLLTFDDCDP